MDFFAAFEEPRVLSVSWIENKKTVPGRGVFDSCCLPGMTADARTPLHEVISVEKDGCHFFRHVVFCSSSKLISTNHLCDAKLCPPPPPPPSITAPALSSQKCWRSSDHLVSRVRTSVRDHPACLAIRGKTYFLVHFLLFSFYWFCSTECGCGESGLVYIVLVYQILFLDKIGFLFLFLFFSLTNPRAWETVLNVDMLITQMPDSVFICLPFKPWNWRMAVWGGLFTGFILLFLGGWQSAVILQGGFWCVFFASWRICAQKAFSAHLVSSFQEEEEEIGMNHRLHQGGSGRLSLLP